MYRNYTDLIDTFKQKIADTLAFLTSGERAFEEIWASFHATMLQKLSKCEVKA